MASHAGRAHRHGQYGRGGHRRRAGGRRHQCHHRHQGSAPRRPGDEPDRGEAVHRLPLLRPELTQPVDHRHPSKGTFQQRITVLHKDVSRPTVFYTGGYNVSTTPSRREPTQIVDGNQVSLEYRYFTPSRPAPADWSKLDIWQAASDQHRIFKALKKIYSRNWISTGGSKGGMTATYYERFYPRDMDGVVA